MTTHTYKVTRERRDGGGEATVTIKGEGALAEILQADLRNLNETDIWVREVDPIVSEDPTPCPIESCIVEGLNDGAEMAAHLIEEHGLQTRKLVCIADHGTGPIGHGTGALCIYE